MGGGTALHTGQSREAWEITSEYSKESSHRDMCGKSNPGSGSMKCKGAEQETSVAGAAMREEIRVG